MGHGPEHAAMGCLLLHHRQELLVIQVAPVYDHLLHASRVVLVVKVTTAIMH